MAGPTPNQNQRSRIEELERRLAALTREVRGVGSREGRLITPPGLRLAKTVASAEAYPSAPAHTFEIEFVDGSYTEAAGNGAPTYDVRGSEKYALEISGAYYPEGAAVAVAEMGRQYWIGAGERISKVIEFTLTEAIVGAAASAAATVDAYYDGADPGSPLSVYNTHGAITAAPIGSTGQAIWDDYRGRYQIVEAGGSGGGGDSVLWGRAQANWSANAGDPRVSIKLVSGSPGRTSSTVSGSALWCYLPRVHSGDPNVVSGQNLPYVFDQDGAALCVGDYLDATIGTVRMWVGTKATIPTGWGLMDGVENAVGNGGKGFAMVSGSDQYFPLATDVDAGGGNGAVGTSTDKSGATGSNTVTVPAHAQAAIAAILAAHDAASIDNHAAGVTGSGTANVSNHTGNTGLAGTGLTGLNVLCDAHGYSCHNVEESASPPSVECVDCEIDTHILTVNDPTHQHSLGTLSHTDTGHIHSTPAHAHSGTLTHSVTADLAHSVAACRPEFLQVMFIERLNNSA